VLLAEEFVYVELGEAGPLRGAEVELRLEVTACRVLYMQHRAPCPGDKEEPQTHGDKADEMPSAS
jgi:hypothetical protein